MRTLAWAALGNALRVQGDLLCLRHNLVDNLSKAGQYREAAALIPELRELAAAHGSTLDRLRLDWVEARVAGGLGDPGRARSK